MSYSIRRRLSGTNPIIDEYKVKTADEAVQTAERMAGKFVGVVTDSVRDNIRNMEKGETLWIRKPALKLSIRVKRSK